MMTTNRMSVRDLAAQRLSEHSGGTAFVPAGDHELVRRAKASGVYRHETLDVGYGKVTFGYRVPAAVIREYLAGLGEPSDRAGLLLHVLEYLSGDQWEWSDRKELPVNRAAAEREVEDHLHRDLMRLARRQTTYRWGWRSFQHPHHERHHAICFDIDGEEVRVWVRRRPSCPRFPGRARSSWRMLT